MDNLRKRENAAIPDGPVVLCIMDGVGVGRYPDGDMVLRATTPNLDWLRENALTSQLQAHGTAVGLPSDEDMGNSEVGHNAIGCGRVFEQGARLINAAIADRAIYEGQVWRQLVDRVRGNRGVLHFIGLFSDGNVHSNISHLRSMLQEAKQEGVKKARIHILLDGRDVPPTSALEYVDAFEGFLVDINADGAVDYRIASGGGRMKVTMDRYNADWAMVERGWKTHVKGEGRFFSSARQAIETFRKEKPGVLDQDLPAFVIANDDKPIGTINDGDSVVFFNYRGDRAIEISRAFEEGEEFREFERGDIPDVLYAGMMRYDGDLNIPEKFLVAPPQIDRTMAEYLAKAGVRMLALSETQKYGHVTYFFNGNRSGKFDERLEDYVEIPSDRVPFEERPWMKSAEITDHILDAIAKGEYRFIRLNYPNGDMVGHTGVIEAAEIAVESVDLAVGRLMKAVEASCGVLIVSADHGNSDDMLEHDGKTGKVKYDDEGKPKSKTSHSLNPVPVHVYDPSGRLGLRLGSHQNLGISSLAATCMVCLGYEPPDGYTPSVVEPGE